ncbi:hypothetical protein FNO01nite_18450 [Flavobacterium noncentrifugens]|uniref:hypothetical protein n=2 Tax=Flavobacterium noncentrifugens TaxID=1128970 RepID=UPI000B887CBC|nr:hypothetical protein [Flavobacterium noncentrifugens]GEP51173.1 hypothetical protein FNO01nite_18450 [Flavobacterium noncentrifugens]
MINPNTIIMENIEAEKAVSIVREILAPRLSPEKITYKTMKGYTAILLEDDRYQTICRLYLNNERRKYLGILSKHKIETRSRIQSINEIFNHSNDLLKNISIYIG